MRRSLDDAMGRLPAVLAPALVRRAGNLDQGKRFDHRAPPCFWLQSAKPIVLCHVMKQKRFRFRAAPPSRLQSELLTGILDVIRADELAPGARLAEVALAERLQVSRTPVRAALKHLAQRGLVQQGKRRGYVVGAAPPAVRKTPPRPGPSDVDRLFLAIARDRRMQRLPEEVSEGDLMRRYGVTRTTVQRVLGRLGEVAAVQRKPGHGWRFLPIISDPQARAESFRFRMTI